MINRPWISSDMHRKVEGPRLLARITGAISRNAPLHGAGRSNSLSGLVEFRSGFCSHDGGVAVHRAGDLVCMALGSPRFEPGALHERASTAGIAAAWLDAFRERGARAPAAAKGRFAVVVLNGGEGSAWLAVDRFGTHPLCHAIEDGMLAFATRADEVPVVAKALDTQALFDYLYFHMIPAPRTVFAGVERLLPGHVLHWRDGKARSERYWTPRFAPDRSLDLEAGKLRFLEIVESAVARETSDGQPGAFLSGGTDSSTVSGMLCRVLGRPAPTYSIGFDAAGYDEMAYARIAAKHFGTDHHEYYVTPDDLIEGIPKVAAYYDEPFGNSSVVPSWLCARNARNDGITRMLAGDGGDELFGGNSRYAKQRIFGFYDAVPGVLRSSMLEPMLGLRGMDRVPVVKKAASYVSQARVPLPDRMGMYNLLLRLGPTHVLTADFLGLVQQEAPLAAQRTVWAETAGQPLVNRMLAFDWKYTLADNDLSKVLGSTALAGVEVAFPLLSDELLEFSLTLPAEWKLKGLTLRWFFKEALRGFLPDEIIAKKKHGFGLPFGVWASQHAGLRSMARDSLETLKQRGIVRGAFIDDLLTNLLPAHPGYYGEMVWILQMLELWLREHAPEYRL
ncbi:Amidotransferase, similar to asparagine synthase [Aromatoleum aromaticum EbN1]|uniref:asparagine synthase (glutamine-hydrolyzing) n=2 Tax=Aromatoleum aromaticum TaxID=551760 RepID=Q5P2B4_AROAE|nr:asparagine synthase C-terminal domain-containing protein [Aromatoleum aromaticum]CAI08550.1 Amidotransferase, similar to asparagine synthase [Aromatoleum aromaticum EbN1]